MGAAASIDKHLAPRTKKVAGRNRRVAKREEKTFHDIIMERFDKNKGGSLCRAEVKQMCSMLMHDVAPGLGDLTEVTLNAYRLIGRLELIFCFQ